MNELVKLAPSLDDLYAGFNDFDPVLDSKALQYDEDFQQTAFRSSHGRRGIGTGFRTSGPTRSGTAGYSHLQSMATSRRKSSTTSIMQPPPTGARPMTAVRGAGYSSRRSPSGSTIFDPFNQMKSTLPFTGKDETSPEAKLKSLERKVNNLLEESIQASDRGEFKLALDKAKQAVAKERSLMKQKQQNSSSGSSSSESMPISLELTFAVLFNLSIQYTRNGMFSDAINILQTIIKNRSFPNSGRLKLNIGSIYYAEGNYPKAIKFFRMALDQINTTHRHTRMRIMRNIGLTFVKLNQYTDALTSFEYIMTEKADFRDALHTIVCHYAIGDRENMKKAFGKLLTIHNFLSKDQFNLILPESTEIDEDEDALATLIAEVTRSDQLRKWENERKHERDWCILVSAKLIAPTICDNFTQGYEWCLEQIRSAGYLDIANDLEIDKAVKHLKKREFSEAIGTLKIFEKKEGKAASSAATNLSFLYLIQGDISQAEKYADDAIDVDRFNCGALINKGNCCYKLDDHERAQQYYREALSIEPSGIEALYNLALTNKKMSRYDVALNCLLKINNIIANFPTVLFEIADVYELMGDRDTAMDWYQLLSTFVPSDPGTMNRMSNIASDESDRHLALSYLNDSYRYFPSHIPTIEQIAAHYIETQVYEKAVKYLERAAAVQPNQVKWFLMIAACYRRSGNYQQAYTCYKMIHRKFPENIECVKFLVRICHDLELPELKEYAEKLKKLDKAKESAERRAQSSRSQRSANRTSAVSNMRSAENNRTDSASSNSNSSGYMTSSVSSKNGGKKKSIFDLINGKNGINDGNGLLDADELINQEQRPTTSWKRRNDEDDFANEDLINILPE